ncbi:MAG: response regulator transcription factor [Spiribacter sp.]|nr:response regulator transcription factor [Spiribacter sp.]
MKRALMVDADSAEQHRLSQVLMSLWPQIDLAIARCLDDAYALLSQSMPGLLITDFYLTDGSGLEIIDQVRRLHPDSPRVLMTRYDDDDHICAALKHGIDGYILKDQSDTGVKNLLRAVAKGEPGLSPEIMRQVLRQFESHELDTDDNQLPTIDRAREMGLTEREIEVLAHLSQGKDRHEVGEILSIRPSTVAGHIKAIYLKLNVSTRAEATLAAVKLGVVDLPD